MALQNKNTQDSQQLGFKTKEEASSALESSLNKLVKAGGFSFLENVIDGLPNLNPERKARKNIFLSDPAKATEREQLKKRLGIWLELLGESETVADIVEKSEKKAEESDK